MLKEEFNNLEVLDQLEYVNKLLEDKQTLRKISSDLNMSKTTIRDRFKNKIGYSYNTVTKRYIKDSTLDIQLPRNIIKVAHKRIKQDKVIKEVAITKEEDNNMLAIKELIEMKDQLNEVIQEYNRSKSIVTVPVSQELRIDKEKFEGELKGRLIKVYSNVNDAWITFCKDNNQFKMQDLYSLALLHFIETYKK